MLGNPLVWRRRIFHVCVIAMCEVWLVANNLSKLIRVKSCIAKAYTLQHTLKIAFVHFMTFYAHYFYFYVQHKAKDINLRRINYSKCIWKAEWMRLSTILMRIFFFFSAFKEKKYEINIQAFVSRQIWYFLNARQHIWF